jgi:hypothetical protein
MESVRSVIRVRISTLVFFSHAMCVRPLELIGPKNVCIQTRWALLSAQVRIKIGLSYLHMTLETLNSSPFGVLLLVFYLDFLFRRSILKGSSFPYWIKYNLLLIRSSQRSDSSLLRTIAFFRFD